MNDIESLCSHSPGKLISVTIEPRYGLKDFINTKIKATRLENYIIVLNGNDIWRMINVNRKLTGFINRLNHKYK
jgi:hypothetical protein